MAVEALPLRTLRGFSHDRTHEGGSCRYSPGSQSGEPGPRMTKEEAMFTSEQVAQYQREGYAIHPGLPDSDEVAALLADIESICAGNTLAHHDQSRMEMEPNQPPDGTRVSAVHTARSTSEPRRSISPILEREGCARCGNRTEAVLGILRLTYQ